MTSDKVKPLSPKSSGGPVRPLVSAVAAGVGGEVRPLFRAADWISFGITSLVMFLAYFYTLAPDLTLQDSGELAVASYYAGVPHPPGYPVWTLYTWLFTVLLPIGNIAYRVGISSAVAGALTCGFVAILVSRGSSMLMEGIEEFKGIAKRWENELCIVSGIVAGGLIGFDGFMWSQAVIVEVYTFTALTLIGVLVALFRWLYAPHQHRYLYLAWFIFGVAVNNHQSVLVCAIAMEVLILLVQPEMGRDLLLGNTIIWILGLMGKSMGIITTLNDNPPLMVIFCLVGLGSAVGFVWLWIRTRRVLSAMHWGMFCFFAFAAGALLYLYMPVASMTNPPLNWGYPRTVAGFFHALTRGQYERIHPTTGVGTGLEWLWSFIVRYTGQIKMLFDGSVEESNLVYVLMAVVPYLYLKRMQARERAWQIGLAAFYLMLGPFLMLLFNPQPDRQSLSLNKVFFTPFHTIVAMGTGYGLTLLLAELASAYERVRTRGLLVLAGVTAIAIYGVFLTYSKTAYIVPHLGAILGLVLAAAALVVIAISRQAMPMGALLSIAVFMPAYSALFHWSENEQRGHLFGFWFGHDMFTPPFNGPDGKPLYPKMAKDAILFGGTDPGRFCPTYMIFCESFIPPSKRRDPDFDRRDVYIITQNALADGTYLQYIRAHYFRSAQIDPPFFSELVRSQKERETDYRTNLLAQMLLPVDRFFLKLGDSIEKERRVGTSWFKESDILNPAGFCRALKLNEKPKALSKYLMDNLTPEARELVKAMGDDSLPGVLARELNRIMDAEYEANRKLPGLREEAATLTNRIAELKAQGKGDSRACKKAEARLEVVQKEILEAGKLVPFYTPERFQDVTLSDYVKQFVAQNPQLHSRIRLMRLLLEEAYPKVFARSKGGVYPDREIYTPSNEDSQKCFADYMADAQERMKKGQLKPGEDVRIVDNRVQVSGQVAVMAINGLLTKVIFDHNPQNEFYVEESFPLDWMFPHLTPYGIIMKIERNPVPEITEDMVRRDHEFWSQYSQRLIGNWITYETSISNICAFAEKIYVNHDYRDFTGDPRFVRDDDAQKAFSKLRSSIGGLYAWRVDNARTEAERQRALKEAEFAFKQAFAFCPYSPEALYRFVNILIRSGRVDEARMMADVAKKLDPDNGGLDNLVKELQRIKEQQQNLLQGQAAAQLPAMEAEFRARPGNVSNALQLANTLAQMGQTERVRQIADVLLTNSTTDASAVYFTVQVYSQLRDTLKLETALQHWSRVNPTPEAWLDLAAIKTLLNKQQEALAALKTCLDLNTRRLSVNPKASNLALAIPSDERIKPLKDLPAFQELLKTPR